MEERTRELGPGVNINSLIELEMTRLERAKAGQGPNDPEPCTRCGGSGRQTMEGSVLKECCMRCLGTGVE